MNMNCIHYLDLLGTFVFALTGAFRAVKYELDLLGVLALSATVGLGGGICRDVLLGMTAPAALRSMDYFAVTSAAGLAVFFFASRIARRWRLVLYLDSLGLAVFAAVGAEKGCSAGLGAVGVMVVATMTAVGGGVIRDVLTGELPYIFRRDIYATATLAGGLVYWMLAQWGFGFGSCFGAAFVTVGFIRIIALRYHLNLPRVKRLPKSPSELATEAEGGWRGFRRKKRTAGEEGQE